MEEFEPSQIRELLEDEALYATERMAFEPAVVDACIDAVERTIATRLPADYRWAIAQPPRRLRQRIYHDLDLRTLRAVGCGLGLSFHQLLGYFSKRPDAAEVLGKSPNHFGPHGNEPVQGSVDLVAWASRLMTLMHDDGHGHNYLCLDFGFDDANPPVVRVDGEASWADVRKVTFVAPSFTKYLQLEICQRSQFDPDEILEGRPVPDPTELGERWITHRDELLDDNHRWLKSS